MKTIWRKAYSAKRRLMRHPRSCNHLHWQTQDTLIAAMYKLPARYYGNLWIVTTL